MANEVEPSYVLPVVDVVHETADAVSVSLGIPDEHREVFAFRPGQFLTLAIPSDTMGLVARCYSMSSTPLRPDPVTVTVKRTPDGFGSIWVHDHLRVGDKVRVLAPSGIFIPRSLDDDLLLFAAGSGITPIMSIIRTALSPVEIGGGTGRLALFYANRDRASVIFHDELAALAAGPSRPAQGRALARGRTRAAEQRTDCRVRDVVPVVELFLLRPQAVHGGGRRRAEGAGLPARAPAPGALRLARGEPVRVPGRGGRAEPRMALPRRELQICS